LRTSSSSHASPRARADGTLVRAARKIDIPGVAHMINMEAPEAFNRHLLAFLRTID